MKNRVVVSVMALNARLDLISNDLLLERTTALVGSANRNLAELLRYLGEVDSRKLYREHACSSMFSYCTTRLGLSEGATYKRIQVARIGRRFPMVIEMISDGRLHLSAVKSVAPLLTRENHAVVLAQASGQSSREVDALVARLQSKPDVPELVRRLPRTRASAPVGSGPSTEVAHVGSNAVETQGAQSSTRRAASPDEAPFADTGAPMSSTRHVASPDRGPSVQAPRSVPASQRASITPLREDRFKVQFSASTAFREKLSRARELLGVCGKELESILEQALEELVGTLEKKKWASTDRAQKKTRTTKRGSRHIPHRVKRAVAERDGKRCTFLDKIGRRCDERNALEFHHREPHARGGDASVENIALLCRAHNALEAERDFGARKIARMTRETRRRDSVDMREHPPARREQTSKLSAGTAPGEP
jgi:5-methylcytosine-specific restriction endonuclease McrA